MRRLVYKGDTRPEDEQHDRQDRRAGPADIGCASASEPLRDLQFRSEDQLRLIGFPLISEAALQTEPALADVLVATLAAMSPELRDRTLGDDPAKAALWIRATAEYGLPEGQLAFGRLLLEGRGVVLDQAQALGWFHKAAAGGDPEAQNMVGRCLENGWGAAADYVQAAVWYGRAADAGYDWAQYNLGHLYLNGLGVSRDPFRAYSVYRRAADQGHARAMNLVSRCYEEGWGVDIDRGLAREWARRSALGGYFRGQYNFGLMLADEGLLSEARPWLERALAGAPPPSHAVMAAALKARTERSLAALGRAALGLVEP